LLGGIACSLLVPPGFLQGQFDEAARCLSVSFTFLLTEPIHTFFRVRFPWQHLHAEMTVSQLRVVTPWLMLEEALRLSREVKAGQLRPAVRLKK